MLKFGKTNISIRAVYFFFVLVSRLVFKLSFLVGGDFMSLGKRLIRKLEVRNIKRFFGQIKSPKKD